MRVLQISPSDNLIGGATRVAMDIKQGLEKTGHEAPMFVGKKFSNFQDVFEIGKTFWQKGLSFLLANDIDFFKTDFIVDSDVFKSADIVNCHNLHGWYFKLDTLRKMADEKPVVWTLHDMWAVTAHCSHAFQGKERNGFYECPNLKIYPSLLWHNENYLEKRKREIYGKTNLNIVVPSMWLKKKVEKSVLGNKMIKLIYNGIDTDVFRNYDKKKARIDLNLPLHKRIILFIGNNGRHSSFKGLDYVAKMVEYYKTDNNIIFACLGGTKDDMELDSHNVIYLKKTADKNVLAKYYSAADIFLFTSLAETFPLVILEAMSCGLPIVSFDVGGVKEAMKHMENGYLAKYAEEKDLIAGIDYLLKTNEKNLINIKENSIKKVREKFSLERMTSEYLEFYKSLI